MARILESFSAQQKRSEFPSQNLAPMHLKLMTNIANLADEIKKHNAAVRRNSRDRVRYRRVCAVCTIGEVFAPHELRRRWLRYMDGNKVLRVRIWLARWKCCTCGRRFTDHPNFRFAV